MFFVSYALSTVHVHNFKECSLCIMLRPACDQYIKTIYYTLINLHIILYYAEMVFGVY